MRKFAALLAGMVMVVLLLAPSARADGFESGAPIVVSGPNVYIIWLTQPSGQFNDQVFIRRSQDGGSNWLTQKQLTFDSDGASEPALAVSESNVYIAYTGQDINHVRQTFLLQSTNRGAAWQAPLQLSNVANFVINPEVVATGSTVVVFWEQLVAGFAQVVYSRSTDNGSTWAVPQVLHSSNGGQYNTSAAVDGQTIVVAYSEVGGSAEYVKFIRTLDGGATWQDSTSVIAVNGTSAVALRINLDGSQVGILWVGNTIGTYQAMFSKSNDGGLNWLPAIQVSQASTSTFDADLSHSGAFGYVAYSTGAGPTVSDIPGPSSARVYFARSLDSGLDWNLPKALTPLTRRSSSPSVAASGAQVLVTYWALKKNAIGTGLTLYLRRSADNGATWQPAKVIGKGQILL